MTGEPFTTHVAIYAQRLSPAAVGSPVSSHFPVSQREYLRSSLRPLLDESHLDFFLI